MSEYICRLGTPSGEIVTRIVEAVGADAARSQLEVDGFRVFSVSIGRGWPVRRFFDRRSRKKGTGQASGFSFVQSAAFCLASRRYSCPAGDHPFKSRSASANLREVLADVEEKIKSGVPLSQAFEMQGIFPEDIYCVDPCG